MNTGGLFLGIDSSGGIWFRRGIDSYQESRLRGQWETILHIQFLLCSYPTQFLAPMAASKIGSPS